MKGGAVSEERSPEKEAMLKKVNKSLINFTKKKAYDLRNEVQLPRWAAGTAYKNVKKDIKRICFTELVQLLRSSQSTIKVSTV